MSMILRYMTMSTGMIGNAMMAALLLIRMVDTMPTRGMDSRAVRNITTMANIMEGMMASGVRTTMICGKRGWQVVGGHHILLHLHGVFGQHTGHSISAPLVPVSTSLFPAFQSFDVALFLFGVALMGTKHSRRGLGVFVFSFLTYLGIYRLSPPSPSFERIVVSDWGGAAMLARQLWQRAEWLVICK